jgi:ubiquinone/menaquinone biosynthesis C-methylase UbiE
MSESTRRSWSPNPFRPHPLRRYEYAWDRLAGRSGRHLDVGFGDGEFLRTLQVMSPLLCEGVDAHPGYVADFRKRFPHIPTYHVSQNMQLPYPDASFESVSLLDVLEHCANEDVMLTELHRVVVCDGIVVLTTPARHIFSLLDPDNAKFRAPRLHRSVCTRKYGGAMYRERFIDTSNGLIGDMAIEKHEHSNYEREWLRARVEAHGFEVVDESGAHLFGHLLQIPFMFVRGKARRLVDRAMVWDGKRFKVGKVFLTARRR